MCVFTHMCIRLWAYTYKVFVVFLDLASSSVKHEFKGSAQYVNQLLYIAELLLMFFKA